MLQPTRLGTAELLPPQDAERFHPLREGAFWLGRSPLDRLGQLSGDGSPMAADDDRHVLICGGTRGGKGTGYVVPNLCLWPGSILCVDPKGENAMLTADARAEGRNGHPQSVYVLDPFSVAQLQDEELRAAFNPLWELMEHDPDGEDYGTPEDDDYEPALRPIEDAVDEASIIANAIVVDGDGKPGQGEFWHGSARRMVSALILHVISNPRFRGRRNLITVRQLLMAGDEQLKKLVEDAGNPVPNTQLLMWNDIALNDAFEGVLQEEAPFFADICANDPEQFSGVLGTAAFHTDFLKSPKLRKTLKRSSFGLDELKADERGISIYLCLPPDYIKAEHYRWLRMVIGLAGRAITRHDENPACGHKVLMVLDEFTSLRRMSYLEEALTMYAGYGLKMFIIIQTLDRLKTVYDPGWESFVSQCGIKIFFNCDDNLTREYVSKLVGETEIVVRQQGRQSTKTLTGAWSETDTTSHSRGGGSSQSEGEAHQLGSSTSWNRSKGQNTSWSRNEGWSETDSANKHWAESEGEAVGTHEGVSQGVSRSLFGMIFGFGGVHYESKWMVNKGSSYTQNRGFTHGGGTGYAVTQNHGSGEGGGESLSSGDGGGQSESRTKNTNRSISTNYSDGTSHATGRSGSEADAAGQSEQEQWHRRPIFLPEEVGRFFSGQDENTKDKRWPGLALVLIGGDRTMVVRRVLYFEDPAFAGLFNQHRKHPVKALPPVATVSAPSWGERTSPRHIPPPPKTAGHPIGNLLVLLIPTGFLIGLVALFRRYGIKAGVVLFVLVVLFLWWALRDRSPAPRTSAKTTK